MIKTRRLILCILFLLLATSTALAATTKGVICSCDDDHIVIATSNGYTCGDMYYQPYGVNAGDYVVGELEMYGYYEIYDIDADTSFNIYIDEFWLSQEDAIRWLRNKR